jgi:hypothetical protein
VDDNTRNNRGQQRTIENRPLPIRVEMILEIRDDPDNAGDPYSIV